MEVKKKSDIYVKCQCGEDILLSEEDKKDYENYIFICDKCIEKDEEYVDFESLLTNDESSL